MLERHLCTKFVFNLTTRVLHTGDRRTTDIRAMTVALRCCAVAPNRANYITIKGDYEIQSRTLYVA